MHTATGGWEPEAASGAIESGCEDLMQLIPQIANSCQRACAHSRHRGIAEIKEVGGDLEKIVHIKKHSSSEAA